MSKQANRLVLVLLALALLVSPLRSTWAMSTQDTADSGSHCAQMQDNTPSADTHHPLSANDADSDPDKTCNGCCDVDCINMDCNACAHAASAIADILTVLTATPVAPASTLFAHNYSERTVIPLLRPPASL
jgi:hypothetical protein